MEPGVLIQRYVLGIATDDEVRKLESLLKNSEALRRRFVLATQLDAVGRDAAIEQSVLSIEPVLAGRSAVGNSRRERFGKLGWLMFAAASAFIAFLLWPTSKVTVATIASSENAAWESSLPTSPGEPLIPGTMNLKAGVATIRFDSGAELLLEAPAQLELISRMRCKLNSGAAIVNVPEAAVGFVVESPGGYAEDFGTRFAIRVDDQQGHSDFELIEGEIAVHHTGSGDSMRLRDAGEKVLVADQFIRKIDDSGDSRAGDEAAPKSEKLLVGTNGRWGTAMPRFEKRWKYIDPAFLSVKRSNSGKWDYRSFFSFDVSEVDFEQFSNVRLRLNLVPSRRGTASRLPKVNRFGVFGLTNAEKFDWQAESRWEDSPGPKDGELLGTFDVQRSVARGVFGIEGVTLHSFLKAHRGTPVTLILVRETTQIEGVGPGLTHMFASDLHPESVGPQLEFSVR